jgi:putative membrane protein
VRADLALLRRHPSLVLASVVIALVPALYALTYLISVWDPNAKTQGLKVALVNLDEGFSYRGKHFNVGADLAQELERTSTFGYRTMPGEAEAREAVNAGELAFAVVIPTDFSANAIPGQYAGAGRVKVIISEGNNYVAAGFGRRFAQDLGHRVNETLNENRWEQVLQRADHSGRGLERLRQGVNQLHDGAENLQRGMVQYTAATAQLGGGVDEFRTGLKGLQQQLPNEYDQATSRAAHQRVLAGQRELGAALDALRSGASNLASEAAQMQEQAVQIPQFGGQIASAAGGFAAGGFKLTDGIAAAAQGNERLIQGVEQLDAANAKLLMGANGLRDGLKSSLQQLPEHARLQELSSNGETLTEGLEHLAMGLHQLQSELPRADGATDASPRGLADSVEPLLEVLAPVPNNGNAFVPNMVAMALWLGAVMATYLFSLRNMPREFQNANRLTKTLAKFFLPAVLVLLQSGITYLMLVVGLAMQIPDVPAFVTTLAVTSLAFLALVFLLLRVFGEAGKLLAVMLLTLQLAAGGGVMPVELSADFFQKMHDYLPLTWAVMAFRASLFGAYNHAWFPACALIAQMGAVALLLACLRGRWRYVSRASYKPSIDL